MLKFKDKKAKELPPLLMPNCREFVYFTAYKTP